jgi:hypothetical protein
MRGIVILLVVVLASCTGAPEPPASCELPPLGLGSITVSVTSAVCGFVGPGTPEFSATLDLSNSAMFDDIAALAAVELLDADRCETEVLHVLPETGRPSIKVPAGSTARLPVNVEAGRTSEQAFPRSRTRLRFTVVDSTGAEASGTSASMACYLGHR